jgi:hypothetical protein
MQDANWKKAAIASEATAFSIIRRPDLSLPDVTSTR